MINFFSVLSSSDKISIISACATTLISIVSIVIAVLTLRQTNKITQEANRPYIGIYYEAVSVTHIIYFLVLKNFGTTGAIIDSVEYTPDFKNGYDYPTFGNLSNHFIAPTQKITAAVDFKEPYTPITFTVKYHSGKKYYTESFIINPEAIMGIPLAKSMPHGKSELEKIISYSAQEIIRTHF